MADINKPDLTNLWASDGAVIPPSPSKIKTGWVAEIPPHQWENFVQNRQDVALAYLLQKGVPEWDEKTEYIANKSFVQLGGDIYKCIQTNTGENPSSKPDYWKPLREVYSEELELGSAASADVVQNTGSSTSNVMSQKAVTDELSGKANLSDPGSMGLGVGQTWQNMVSGRSFGTTYTNTTGRTICVSLNTSIGGSNPINGNTWTVEVFVDSLVVARMDRANLSEIIISDGALFTVVPHGSTYRVENDNSLTIGTHLRWLELR